MIDDRHQLINSVIFMNKIETSYKRGFQNP